jgi:hypothetical protein
MVMRLHVSFSVSLLLLPTIAAFGETPPPPPTNFASQVTAHFVAWDKDKDGVFSKAEVDAAMADPEIVGTEAAAIVSIKRAVRTKTYQLPPLTSQALQQLASAKPAKGKPDFEGMYKAAFNRLPKDNKALFTAGTPKLDVVRQGKLGDCFCLAPLGAMLARNPQDVAALFQRQPDNTYKVQIGHQSVSVAAPTEAEIVLSASTQQTGMWVNLYEKAVGTIRLKPTKTAGTETSSPSATTVAASVTDATASPMDAVGRGGSAGTMLSMLTGHKIIRLSCSFAKSDKTTPAERDEKLGKIREQLTLAQKERRLMTTGTTRPKTPGITPNHAYAVLGYDAKTDTIQLWNPHGDNFTPKGIAGLEYGYPRKAGVFSMPLTDFVSQFAGLAFETTEIALPSDPVPAPDSTDQSSFPE